MSRCGLVRGTCIKGGPSPLFKSWHDLWDLLDLLDVLQTKIIQEHTGTSLCQNERTLVNDTCVSLNLCTEVLSESKLTRNPSKCTHPPELLNLQASYQSQRELSTTILFPTDFLRHLSMSRVRLGLISLHKKRR
jgi:hypothetical protein